MKIIDGEGTEVFNQDSSSKPFSTETLLDVQFGSSGKISIQMYLGSNPGSVKIKFAVLKNGVFSGAF